MWNGRGTSPCDQPLRINSPGNYLQGVVPSCALTLRLCAALRLNHGTWTRHARMSAVIQLNKPTSHELHTWDPIRTYHTGYVEIQLGRFKQTEQRYDDGGICYFLTTVNEVSASSFAKSPQIFSPFNNYGYDPASFQSKLISTERKSFAMEAFPTFTVVWSGCRHNFPLEKKKSHLSNRSHFKT